MKKLIENHLKLYREKLLTEYERQKILQNPNACKEINSQLIGISVLLIHQGIV